MQKMQYFFGKINELGGKLEQTLSDIRGLDDWTYLAVLAMIYVSDREILDTAPSILKAIEMFDKLEDLDVTDSDAVDEFIANYKDLPGTLAEQLYQLLNSIIANPEKYALTNSEIESLKTEIDSIVSKVENIIGENFSEELEQLQQIAARLAEVREALDIYMEISSIVRNDVQGFDIFKTSDGENWELVTDDGFGDKYNYGALRFVPTDVGMYITTGNPFYGTQLYLLTNDLDDVKVPSIEPGTYEFDYVKNSDNDETIETNSTSPWVTVRRNGKHFGTEIENGVTIEDGVITINSKLLDLLDEGENELTLVLEDGTVQVTVTAYIKPEPTVTLNGWTYGEEPKTPSVSGNTGNGTVTYTYKVKGAADSTYSSTKPTAAGEYTVKATIAAAGNYSEASVTADFTINKAAITITADGKSSKYGDDIVGLTYQISGNYKTGDDLGITVSTTVDKTSDVGDYVISVAWNENPNYTATLTAGKYTVTKTDLAVSATGYSGKYDGKGHSITVDVGSHNATVYYAKEELTADNYKAAGSTTNPAYTNAGEYTVYFYVVSKNYAPDTVSGSKTVSITKADALTATDDQKPTANTGLIADNTDQALVTAPKALPDGYTKVQYSLDGGKTWTDTIPTGKTTGNYTVSVKYVADGNHTDFDGEDIKVTIGDLTVQFEANGGSSVDKQSLNKGDKAARPADPTRKGYAFDGWYSDAEFKTAFDFAAPVTADITLYAKWTPNDYTVTSVTGLTGSGKDEWTKGGKDGVVITVKLSGDDDSFEHFVGVKLDGKELVKDVDYTVKKGSTIVTLLPATLEKLAVGEHTVTVLFDNGEANARFTVLAANNGDTTSPQTGDNTSPQTGDNSHLGLWIMLMILSLAGFVTTMFVGKRKHVK